MAGNRQHTLPRFLQKGFANAQGKLWVYRKDGKCFQTDPTNIGVETKFYGNPGPGSLDEKITKSEEDQSSCLDELRLLREDTIVHHSTIPEIVVSLAVRSRWLREEFSAKTDMLIDEISTKLPLFNGHFAGYIKRSPQIQGLIGLGFPERQVDALIENFLKSDQFKEGLAGILARYRSGVKAATRRAHNDALAKHFICENRMAEYQNLQWRILVRPAHTFLLSDVAVMFRTKEGRYKALSEKGDSLSYILLPIAHTHLLLGQYNKDLTEELAEWRAAFIKCSFEFIICSKELNDPHGALSQIGKWSEILSEKEMAVIAEECMKQVFDESLDEF